MEENQDHIIKTFREGLAHHEVAVSDSVWAGVQATMATKAAASSAAVSTSFIKAASVVGVSAVVGLGAFNEIGLQQVDQAVDPIVVEQTDREIEQDNNQIEEKAIAVDDKAWNEGVNQSESNHESSPKEIKVADTELRLPTESPEQDNTMEQAAEIAEATDEPEVPTANTENEIAESKTTTKAEETSDDSQTNPAKDEVNTKDESQEPKAEVTPPIEEPEEELTCSLKMTHAAKAFISPDGDGTNECFRAEGAEAAASFKVTIWTRAGDLLFESTDPNFSWCGTDRFGNLVESRTMCYYKIDAFDENGLQYKKANSRGSVQVFR